MKKYFILISIAIFAIAIVFSNCNKETCLGKKHYYYISQTMKDYFGVYLQKGRKWVYENNSKTKLTTLEIIDVTDKKYLKEKCDYYEEYVIEYNQNLLFSNNQNNNFFYFTKYNYNSDDYDENFYNSNGIINIDYSSNNNVFLSAIILDTLIINNNIHYNILKSNRNNNYLFFQKNIGLICAILQQDTFYLINNNF